MSKVNKLARNYHIKHISFKNKTKDNRLKELKLNSLLNTRNEYEYLDDIIVIDDAVYNRKLYKVKKLL